MCGGVYDDRGAGELSSIVSRGSTFAITMVYGLTQLVAAVGTAAELSGHTRRVAALLRGLEYVDATTGGWRRREEEAWRPRPPSDGGKGAVKGAGLARRRRSKDGIEPLLQARRLRICVPPVAPSPYRGGSWGLRMSSSSHFLSSVDLLSGIELCVREGGSVLLRGASGRGKTALLRTVCGLWPMGDGGATDSEQGAPQPAELICVPPIWNRAARCSSSRTYLVLPQSAPLRPGMQTSLRQQLLYPLLDDADSDGHRDHGMLRDALDAVGHSELIARVGGLDAPHSPQEWKAMLSPGQRQLLICARVFVHNPALVLLDEATSAMPVADEARVYERLKASGVAYVSIGHRISLERHHDEIMEV